ncbi:conserved exported hypothetical protein [metagenome]|uniref:Lipopolysaccharide assembly protein A domain-containing protein n=1 Tax=metagenome TaxID=256318 RepID=A0A2P2CEX3_9ZZZZ
MVILGLLLLGIGVVAILAGVFTTDVDAAGQVTLLGVDVTPTSLFVIGVLAGAFVLWGLTVLKIGTKRELRMRREHRELSKLSEKLDRVESDRRADDETS